MPSKKYDEEHVVALAKQTVSRVNDFTELATALEIPRTTLRELLKRQGFGRKDTEIMGALLMTSGGEALVDLDLLQRQAAYLRKVVSRLEKRLADRAWLKEEVAGQMVVMEPVEYPRPAPRGKTGPKDQVSVLELGDVHYGLEIPSGQLGPLFGGYNVDTATACMAHTFQNFARLSHQQSFPVRKAVVYVLGDLIEHSNMRPAQAKYTSIHVVKQTVGMANLLIAGIRSLCREFEEVEIHCVPGNHGRATQRAGDNLPDETFEHLLYHIAEIALSDQPNLKFKSYPTWYFIHDIFTYKFLVLHGEDVMSWAGIPFYGIERLVKDYYMLGGQSTKRILRRLSLNDRMTVAEFLELMQLPDYVCIGHFHNPMLWPIMGVEVLANGAMSGASYFSAKRLHRFASPSQNMFFVHEEHGVGLRLPISLDEIGEK